jgi:peptidoglycan hydrolase-like amidase
LFPDARDQVYKGGNAKQWAANETDHQVARHGGAIIRAFYSSDNNQGAGTANHETIWSDYEGNKNPLPYLRSVDDNSFATKTQWTHWAYTTGGFSYDDLNIMLEYERDNLGYAQAFLSDVINSVGTVTSVDFVRDPSQRVWKVNLHGTNGSRVVAGWLFKAMWNHAAANGKVSGFIYSLTFSLAQKE